MTSSTLYLPDGGRERTTAAAVWTLAYRGYNGGGHLDVWCYPSKAVAVREGAQLAMACGLDEDE